MQDVQLASYSTHSKLLFLDFDGVLHPTSAHVSGLLSKRPY